MSNQNSFVPSAPTAASVSRPQMNQQPDFDPNGIGLAPFPDEISNSNNYGSRKHFNYNNLYNRQPSNNQPIFNSRISENRAQFSSNNDNAALFNSNGVVYNPNGASQVPLAGLDNGYGGAVQVPLAPL